MIKSPVNNVKSSDNTVKYHILNTEIPIIITVDDEILFVIDKELQSTFASNPKLEAEYKEKMNASFEYLVAEGFIDEMRTNNKTHESQDKTTE